MSILSTSRSLGSSGTLQERRVKGALAQPTFWLTGIMSGLALIHLTLVARFFDTGEFGIGVVCWLCVFLLLRKKVGELPMGSDPFSATLGATVITLVLLNYLFFVAGRTAVVHMGPFISGLGLCLLASGACRIGSYWRELVILFSLGFPTILFRKLIDIAPVTAQAAGYLLWYAGYEVKVRGVTVAVAGGAVRVDEGCVGVAAMTYLICLGVIFVLMFPSRKIDWLVVPALALGTALTANTLRVAVLALIDATGNNDAFVYWHAGGGSLIWNAGATAAFGLYCFWLLTRRVRQVRPVLEGSQL